MWLTGILNSLINNLYMQDKQDQFEYMAYFEFFNAFIVFA